MPEFWESQATETATEMPAVQPQAAHEEAAALAVSVDDFSALEERVRRTVGLVKREREARAAAEHRAMELEARAVQAEARHAELEMRATNAEARHADLEARAAQAEAQIHAQSPKVEQLESELKALHAEREQVRQRVDRLLKELDALEL